jgi:hypothetical protein
VNAKRAKLWVDALRSGEFKQGRRLLRSQGGGEWCCLAVLCEVYRRETGKGEWVSEHAMAPAFVLDGYTERSYAPPPVAEWMGLRDDGQSHPSSQAKYVRQNETGRSFEQIADSIARDAGPVTEEAA